MSCPVHPSWRLDATDCPMCAELRPDRYDYLNGMLDENQNPVQVPPQLVKEAIADVMERGRVVALVLQAPDGTMAVRVQGPPTYAIVDALDRAAKAIAQGLKKHAS